MTINKLQIKASTPRLYIRAFNAEEEHLYLALYADESVTQFVNERSAAERKKRFAEGLARCQDGSGLGRWAIFNQGDDDFIGACRLEPTIQNAQHVELGYILHQRYWGKGIATELVQILTDYAFSKTGTTEITAFTHPANLASQRVLEKSGFKRQDDIVKEGEPLAFFKLMKAR
jgi:ribosomal-protein-alanine N-acetyltransferase